MYLEYLRDRVAIFKERGKKVCVFPMGIAGKAMLTKLRSIGIEVDFFCDNNPKLWGQTYCGKVCVSKKELLKQAENVLVIIESIHYKEIKTQLLQEGVKHIERIYFEKIAAEQYISEAGNISEKIQAIKNVCEDDRSKAIFDHIMHAISMESIEDDYFKDIQDDNQYFDHDIVELSENEIFVDVGAYTGDSAEQFLRNCHGKYEKMHLFELDPLIYRRLQNNVPKLQTMGSGIIQCYPYGASDENTVIHFQSGDSNSTISAQDDNTAGFAKVITLDKVLDGEKVTFIKMDIEGAEQSALRGAENIIKAMRPKLAICIYHSLDDMLSIPVWLKKIVPEYKIYIRHYTDEMLETVCYAV